MVADARSGSRSTADRGHARQAALHLSAEDAGVRADVDGMVDEALRGAAATGNIFSRVARDLTGGEEDAQVAAARQLLPGARSTGWCGAWPGASTGQPRTPRWSFPSLEQVKEQNGLQGRARPRCEQRLAQALTVPGVDRRVKAPVTDQQAQGHPRQLAKKYPRPARGRPRQLPAALLQEPPARQDLHGGGGRRGLRHPGRALPHPEQGGRPRLERAQERLGRRPGRHGGPRRHRPRTRSRRAGWASTTAPASTAPTRPTRWAAPPRTAASGWPSRM